MSLDIYLTVEEPQDHKPNIYVRKDGQVKAVSREEYNKQFPGREPITATPDDYTAYTSNITHNLTPMAAEARVYMPCWRPEEIGIETAAQLIEPLRSGLDFLESDPERFEKFNPENGWGTYENLVSFVQRYLVACETYPEAKVSVWR